MSGIGNQNSHTGDSVFENVYIYGKLYYDYAGQDLQLPDNLTVKNLTVLNNSWFGGIATFKDDVYIEGKLDLYELLVRHRLDVGVGGTVFTGINTGPFPGRVGVANTAPFQRFQVGGPNTFFNSNETEDRAFSITGFGTVGIGTTDPQARLDIAGDLALTTASSTIKLQAPSSGDATYILPNNSGADGNYLRYQTGGSGTLEWAQLDSDKIFRL